MYSMWKNYSVNLDIGLLAALIAEEYENKKGPGKTRREVFFDEGNL